MFLGGNLVNIHSVDVAAKLVIAVRVVHALRNDSVRFVEIGKPCKNGLAGNDQWISGVWLNPYSVVHRSAKPLFAAEIFFRRLHGHMSQ